MLKAHAVNSTKADDDYRPRNFRNGHPRTVYLGPRFFVHGSTPMACDACVWGRGEHAEWCQTRAVERDAAAAAYSMATAPKTA